MTKPINAIVTKQWRESWNDIPFDLGENAKKPRPLEYFVTFVMKASMLRTLSGVYRRDPSTEKNRTKDENVQRPHDESRSREIRKFVDFGYPISGMRGEPRSQDLSLRRPGWLPTAIVINILAPGQSREGLGGLHLDDAVGISDMGNAESGDIAALTLPASWRETGWEAKFTPPFEVIDGQHRLWAFDEEEDTPDYYLPVVAFIDLARSFQAYLFWTINIKPRKINTSLAFDLYPMLRSEEWLMQGEGVKVYRESRAQELTEALWSAPSSPWFDRINMIGSTGVKNQQPVTQNSFVRSLLSSFIKPWDPIRATDGGLFGSTDEGGLGWTRGQQAAFLIGAWRALYDAAIETRPQWLRALPPVTETDVPGLDVGDRDPFGRHSMLGSDQGVRAFSLVLNDLTYRLASDLRLNSWRRMPSGETIEPREVEEAFSDLQAQPFFSYIVNFGRGAAAFDWRGAAAPGLTEAEELRKSTYRGSGGYVALRRDLFRLLAASDDQLIAETSARFASALAAEAEKS